MKVTIKDEIPDEEFFKEFLGTAFPSVKLDDLEVEFDPDSLWLASTTKKAWNPKRSDYTDAEWKRACLLPDVDGGKLPVREPDGTINVNALRSAIRLAGHVKGASDEQKKKAQDKARALLQQAGEEVKASEETDIEDRSLIDGTVEQEEPAETEQDWTEALVELSSKANRGEYSYGQWNTSTLIPPQKEGEDGMLPVRNPDGSLNLALLAEAEKALLDKRLKVPVEVQRTAMARLINMIRGADRNENGQLERAALLREGRYSALPEADLEAEFRRESDVAFTLPWQTAKAEKVGKKYWKTLAMPYRTFRYKNTIQKFTRSIAEKIEANFKAGAVPDPGVFLVKDNNEHTDNPEYLRGRIVDVKAAAKGLEVTCEMDPRGEEILSNAPWVKASPFLHHNYYVEANDMRYGPTIVHLAITPRGHIPESGGWEQVMLSEGNTTVIALEATEEGGTVADVQDEQTQGGEKEVENNEETREEETQQEVQLSAADQQKLANYDAMELRLSRMEADRRRDQIERRWEREFASQGVTPAVENHLLPLLLSTADNPDESISVMKLTKDESGNERKEQAEVKLSDHYWALAAQIRDTKGVTLNEENGTSVVLGGDDDDGQDQQRLSAAQALDARVEQYMKDNDVADYGMALRAVTQQEGVNQLG